MPEEDFEQDEMINVKLPRYQYDILKNVLKREEAFSWITKVLSASSVWVIAGGLLTVFALWDRIHDLIMGPK